MTTIITTAPTAASVVKRRHGPTDLLRALAVIAVVLFHARIIKQLPALLGMHALIAAAVLFAARPSNAPVGRIVGRRASRLLIPWLAFSALYFISVAIHRSFQPWMLLCGGSLHLWFVPFIFVITSIVAVTSRSAPLPTGWVRTLFWSATALVMIHIEARITPAIVDRVPLYQFLDGTTAALVAVAVLSVPREAEARAGVAVAIALLSLPLWMPWRTAAMMTVSPAGFGTALLLLVALLPSGANRFTDFLGRSSFGLYLSHVFVLGVCWKLFAHVREVPIDQLSYRDDVISSVATVVLCLLLIAVLERTPARRVVI